MSYIRAMQLDDHVANWKGGSKNVHSTVIHVSQTPYQKSCSTASFHKTVGFRLCFFIDACGSHSEVFAVAAHSLCARNWLVKTSFCHRLAGSKWHGALWIHTTVDTVYVESFWEVIGLILNGPLRLSQQSLNVSPTSKPSMLVGKVHCDHAESRNQPNGLFGKQALTPSNNVTSNGRFQLNPHTSRVGLANWIKRHSDCAEVTVIPHWNSGFHMTNFTGLMSERTKINVRTDEIPTGNRTAARCNLLPSTIPWSSLWVTSTCFEHFTLNTTCSWIVGERERRSLSHNEQRSACKPAIECAVKQQLKLSCRVITQ